MSAAAMHAACYVAARGRQPLREILSRREMGVCAECGSVMRVGDSIAYDVSPVSRPKPVTSAIKDPMPATNVTSIAPVPAPVPAPDLASLASLIGAAVAPIVRAEVTSALDARPAPSLDEDRVQAIVTERLATLDRPTRIEVVDPSQGPARPVDLGLVHEQFRELLAIVRAGHHVWLWGPAGSGKTYVAHQVARALGLEYSCQGAIADRYADLVGYRSVADGVYQGTSFRRAYEHGGLHLIDEIDASQDPGSPLAINAALANGTSPFPDRLVKRHECFRFICAANTRLGADASYVGRIRFDAAFLDRFVILEWRLDEKLERALYPESASVVQTVRRRVRDRGINVLVTPRASERLRDLMAAGVEMDRAARLAIGGLLTDEQWSQVWDGSASS